LIVTTYSEIKYVDVPKFAFHVVNRITDHNPPLHNEKKTEFYKLMPAQVVAFKSGVKVLKIVDSIGGRACLVTEQLTGPNTGQVSFLRLRVSQKYMGHLYLDELNDR
jgi:hypothetical protein